MIKSQAIAQRFYDERANAKRVADAAILAAEADVKQAELNLDYAHVKAPIAGRLSRVEITVGNLVEAGPNAPVLTSIVSNEGIYADFDVDEQTYVNSIRANAATEAEERKISVELTAQGDSTRVYRGTIHSFDNRITTASGTIRARARFDNKDGRLVPGMFVSVRLASSAPSTALLVPDRAIGSDQSKRFVFVVGADSKAVLPRGQPGCVGEPRAHRALGIERGRTRDRRRASARPAQRDRRADRGFGLAGRRCARTAGPRRHAGTIDTAKQGRAPCRSPDSSSIGRSSQA